MRKKFLHILLGTATVLGCYSSLMAAEIGIVNSNTKAFVTPEEDAKVSLRVFEGEEVAVNQEINDYYEIVVDDEIVYIEKEYITVQVEKPEVVEEVAETVETVVTPVEPTVVAPVQTTPV
ncbi:MAG: hypothetical protein H9872_07265, partial [Candidatus Cellulosilyticum pullistercoris]|nr:hypothetical protein [Candidatus Cellulosilyticum pullistercoris]